MTQGKKVINKRKNMIYGNCQVYSPSGQLMFLCLEKRAKWYIKENLGKIVGKNPLSVMLTFEPKGIGSINDEYYLSSKQNICVVCGNSEIEMLTKHHIVPTEYRKYFPDEIKSRSSHDVVVICQKHHTEYENKYAQKLKKELEELYGVSESEMSSEKKSTYKAYGLAQILSDEERRSKIPPEKILLMKSDLIGVFGHDNAIEIAQMNISKLVDEENLVAGKRLVEKIQDIEAFVKMWRQHFIQSMNPAHMPIGWCIDSPIK